MPKVNIPKSKTDIYYRYKRDLSSIQPIKNRGIKWTNVSDIAKQLHANPDVLIRFVTKKLGTSCKNDILAGNFTTINLEDAVEKFVALILCQKCGLPKLVNTICSACGFGVKTPKSNNEERKESKLEIQVADLIKCARLADRNDLADKLWNVNTKADLDKLLPELQNLKLYSVVK